MALYTILSVRHNPFSGQLLGVLQLHNLLLTDGAMVGARTLALCVEIMEAILCMQL